MNIFSGYLSQVILILLLALAAMTGCGKNDNVGNASAGNAYYYASGGNASSGNAYYASSGTPRK